MNCYCRPVFTERWNALGFEDAGVHRYAYLVDGVVQIADSAPPYPEAFLTFDEFYMTYERNKSVLRIMRKITQHYKP